MMESVVPTTAPHRPKHHHGNVQPILPPVGQQRLLEDQQTDSSSLYKDVDLLQTKAGLQPFEAGHMTELQRSIIHSLSVI